MPNIKDLFGNQERSYKVLSAKDITALTSSHDAESFGYIEALQKEEDRFLPTVDYTKPKNFAKYGSAQKYYEDTIKRIYRMYPYDGSQKEKIEWHNASSYLDNYIFDNEYPRTNGYLIFGSPWGTPAATVVDTTVSPIELYTLSDAPQYATVQGGPHAAIVLDVDDEIKSQSPDYKSLSSQSSYASPIANIYDPTTRRASNLAVEGLVGNTVEFWANEPVQFLGTKCVFDLWNGPAGGFPLSDSTTALGSASYGRLLVERRRGSLSGLLNDGANFHFTYMSGTAGASRVPLLLTGTVGTINDSWHHVAITVKNSGLSGGDDGLEIKAYLGGELRQTVLTGTSVSTVTGALNANVGAYRYYPTDGVKSTALAGGVTDFNGWGSLSASIDEFRFWKAARNSQEIGRNWFTQVYGGTNSDDSNTTLGVYYKFNEGIAENDSYDRKILDYSGRISDGTIQNYDSTMRNSGSAMILAGAADSEFKDPILYSFHPQVSALMADKELLGYEYDTTNNASIINTFPDWIVDEDQEVGAGNLQDLIQIIAQYFDNLQSLMDFLNHLKDIEYTKYCEITAVPFADAGNIYNNTAFNVDPPYSASYSGKPLPFSKNLLSSVGMNVPEIFTDAVALEALSSRDNYRIFQQKIFEVKNQIYQNIYNNLNYIFKSKGTEKAFRNLIRCYGVDEAIIKINLYGDNVTHKIKDNYRSVAVKKTYIDFNHTDRFSSAVYQMTSSISPYDINTTHSYIPSGTIGLVGTMASGGYGLTFETEVLFPKKAAPCGGVDYQPYNFLTASVFGTHQAELTPMGDTTWPASDRGDFQVYAVKDVLESNPNYDGDTYFQLTSSWLGINLTSSLFDSVYDNQKWNFAVRIKPTKYPWVGNSVTGTTLADEYEYEVSFYGVNANLDVISNEFSLSASVSEYLGNWWASSRRRLYLGPHRTNFTGTVLSRSDIKISSTRAWYDYLTNDEIRAHARDAENHGVLHPYRNAFVFQTGSTQYYVPRSELLILEWDFSQVTSSDASGKFQFQDISSGSLSDTYAPWITDDRYGRLRDVVRNQYAGKGDLFPANDTNVAQREYIYSAQQVPPEVIESSDMVNILERDDVVFTKESLPIDYYIAVEKSMYQTISQEMLKMFATIQDFNNLIGDPVNRYRGYYKNMEKLKSLFYENIENSPDLDKYVDFYKWIDSSITMFLEQLFPASANYAEDMRTLVESHVLERNAYRNKFPTLELKQEDPETSILGINELTYNWEYGHAPLLVESTALDILKGDATADLGLINLILTVPTSIGGGGVALDLIPHDAPLGAPGADTIRINRGATAEEGADYLISAINGTTDVNVVVYGASVAANATQGIIGISARQGSSPTKVTITVDKLGESGEAIIWSPSGRGPGFWWPGVNPWPPPSSYAGLFKFDLPGPHDAQSANCLWWNQRAERDGRILSQSVESVNTDRSKILHIATTENSGSYLKRIQGSTYVFRKLSRPYKESVSFSKQLHGGVNYSRTKNRDFYRAKINEVGADNVISFDGNRIFPDPERDCNDNNGLKFKQKLKFEMKPSDESDTFKGNLISPFNLYLTNPPATNSVITDIANEVDIVNLHSDTYGANNEVPMQTPFTEKYVGGNQYRHIALNTSSLTNARTRPEGFIIDLANDRMYGPEFGDLSRPRATRTREPLAKRPMNIKNILQTTGSTIIGNYDKNYEVVQTSGRRINNKYFVEAEGVGFGYVTGNLLASPEVPFLSGNYDFQLPDRTVYDSIFTERFSAPGSFDVLSRGYLDPFAEEYSVYNALTFRNWTVRGPRFQKLIGSLPRVSMSASIWSTGSLGLQSLLTRHCGWGGYDYELQTSGAYQKTNRNRLRMIELSGASLTSYVTGSQFDNWWIQHPIPRSDFQYAWITASVDSKALSDITHPGTYGFGYFPPDGLVSSSVGQESAVLFLTASEVASDRNSVGGTRFWYSVGGFGNDVFTSFVGMNTNIYEPQTSIMHENGEGQNLLGYPSRLTPLFHPTPAATTQYVNRTFVPSYSFLEGGDARAFNALMLHRNGPYQYPSWKQIRAGETPVARYHKKNNIFSVSVRDIPSIDKHTVFPRLAAGPNTMASRGKISYKDLEGVGHKGQNLGVVSIRNYTEPLITSKYFPMRHAFDVINGNVISTLVIDHTYTNNLATFANPQLDTKIQFAAGSRKDIRTLKKAPEQIYDRLIDTYVKGTLPADSNPIKGFKNLIYKETVYPKERNTYLAKTRGRINYTEEPSVIQGTSYIQPLGEQRTFWKDDLADRQRTGGVARNALDYTIFSTDVLGPREHDAAATPSPRSVGLSIWPLDVGTRYLSDVVGLPTYSKLSGSNHGQLSINASTASAVTATASFGYEYHNDIWVRMPDHASFTAPVPPGQHLMTDFIPDWQTAELAGKNPWFDSYEDYAQDIRCFGKEYTVLPEFKISDHIDYYLSQQNFQAKNNKFLSLEGGALSQSATSETNPLDSGFFNEYCHTDFLKHFEVVQAEHQGVSEATQITVKCHGIKKLLPYNGFYPMTRTVQLGNLFSQSFSPYLEGSTVNSANPMTERLMSLMQPFFNPGILYNTIKSGLAVDWMAFTGSNTPTYNWAGASFLDSGSMSSSFRLPFESLVDPAAFLPVASDSDTAGDANLFYVDTSRWGGTTATSAGSSRGNMSNLYGRWTGGQATNYTLAMQNFLGESSRFFLQGSKYKNIISGPESKIKSFVSGVTYYMDLVCYKTDDMVMYEGPSNITGSTYGITPSLPGHAIQCRGGGTTTTRCASAKGIHYGPMVSVNDDTISQAEVGVFRFDPATAPYTPPYFYGTSVTTFAFKPHEAAILMEGESLTLTPDFGLGDILGYIKDVGTIHYNDFGYDSSNLLLDALQERPEPRGSVADTFDAACFAGKQQMNNAASFNLFDFVEIPKMVFNPTTGEALYSDPSSFEKYWSISPKFECPVLNFSGTTSTAPGVFPDASVGGDYNTRGMWRGYGNMPGDGTGIYFEVKESFPTHTYAVQGSTAYSVLPLGGNVWNIPLSASLLQHLGFQYNLKQRIGEISETREIFEAVVAIPFRELANQKVFFPILAADDPVTKKVLSRRVVEAILGNDAPLDPSVYTPGASIITMVETMQKYVLPPKLDFITNKNITPFCMYIFEFNHELDKQDLADIWQGVMPKISLKAEKQTATISHFLNNNEILGTGPITKDLRWMVFKVKQKAEKSYYNVTVSTLDDDKYKFNYTSQKMMDFSNYSYNWPYDFFSLVELAKADAAIQIGGNIPITPPDITATEPIPVSVPPPVMAGPSIAIPEGVILVDDTGSPAQGYPAGQIPLGLDITNIGNIVAGQPSPMMGGTTSNMVMQGAAAAGVMQGIKTSGKNMGQYGAPAKKGNF